MEKTRDEESRRQPRRRSRRPGGRLWLKFAALTARHGAIFYGVLRLICWFAAFVVASTSYHVLADEYVFDFRLAQPAIGAPNVQVSDTGKSLMTLRAHSVVNNSAEEAVTVAIGDILVFRLFDDKEFRIQIVEELPTLQSTIRSWMGSAEGYDDVINCVVVKTDSGWQADIQDFKNGLTYQVFSDGRTSNVYENNPNAVNKVCGTEIIAVNGDEQIIAAESISLETSATTSETYVDTLLVFDSRAVAWLNAKGATMESFAATAVAKMNTAIANTGLNSNFRYRLAGTWAIGGSGGTDLGAVLNACYSKTSLNGVDWGQVSKKRDDVGADIVTVLIDIGSSNSGTVTTGIGYCPKTGNYSWGGWSDATYNCCAISYVANDHTMTHETGHNMGCGHADTKFVNPNAISPGPGVFDYASGYHFTANGNKYHTIMAYNFDGWNNSYASCPYFSSPNYKYNGVTVGDSAHDNTRTLQNTFSKVAAFRTLSTGTLKVTPLSKSFTDKSDTGSFSVTASSSWTVAKPSSASWISLNTTGGSGNGTVAYSVAANSTGSERTATITVTCGSNKATHTVSQSAEAAKLSISPASADVSSASTEGAFSVIANYSWTVTASASWISLGTTSGSGNDEVSYLVADNTGSQRTGTITVKSGSLTATHKVTQAAQPTLKISAGSAELGPASGNGSFSVTSDSTWTVTKSASWITLKTTSGMGNGTVSYSVDPNTGAKREGYIYVKSGSVSKTHKVTQLPGDIVEFSESAISIPASGGSGTVSATVIWSGSGDMSASSSSSGGWISWTRAQETISNGYRYTYSWKATANTTADFRTESIRIVLKGVTYSCTFTQDPASGVFRVTYNPGAYGKGDIISIDKDAGSFIMLKNAIYTRDGYMQMGWSKTDGGAKDYALMGLYMEDRSITLYPYWEKKATTYPVQLKPGTYGSGTAKMLQKTHGVALTLPGAQFTRSGYEQTGWSTSAAGTTKAYDLGGQYKTDATATFYPYWTEVTLEDDSLGFYRPNGWNQPLYLATTNTSWWSYAPKYVFDTADQLKLNYCIHNWSDTAVARHITRYITLFGSSGSVKAYGSEDFENGNTIDPGNEMHYRTTNVVNCLKALTPGNYAVEVHLDPTGQSNAYNDNWCMTWFAVKAQGVSFNEALDCDTLDFIQYPEGTPIFAQVDQIATGDTSVQFGPQPTNSFDTALWAEVTGPGTLAFRWDAISSENDKACMVFYVDDVMQKWVWSNKGDWTDAAVDIGEV